MDYIVNFSCIWKFGSEFNTFVNGDSVDILEEGTTCLPWAGLGPTSHSSHSLSLYEHVQAVARCCFRRWQLMSWPWQDFGSHHGRVLPVACCLQGEEGQPSCCPEGTLGVTGEGSRFQQVLLRSGQYKILLDPWAPKFVPCTGEPHSVQRRSAVGAGGRGWISPQIGQVFSLFVTNRISHSGEILINPPFLAQFWAYHHRKAGVVSSS